MKSFLKRQREAKKIENKKNINKKKQIENNKNNQDNNQNLENEELDNNELVDLYKAIDNNEFLFELNLNDDIDFINYNHKPNVNDSEIYSIPLDQINIYKKIVKMVKLIKTYPLNYDYIIGKEVSDIKRKPDLEIISAELSDNECDNEIIEEKESEGICNEKISQYINQVNQDKNESDEIYEKIDDKFISYDKKYNFDKSIWWPINLRYGGKKYSLMTKKYLLINNNHNKIIYYCTNHFINTMKKKIQFKNCPCNGRIEFLRKDNSFYISHKHNSICDTLNKPVYDNLANVTNNVYNFSDFKQKLIEYLNLHPLITFEKFKLYGVKLFLKSEFDFIIWKNTFGNIFYPWRRTAKTIIKL